MHIINSLSGIKSALLLLAITGCGTTITIPWKADAPQPDLELGVADFSDLYNASESSQSVYPLAGATKLYRESMARVLMSPNTLFEASRNSGKEAKTVGPADADWPEPELSNALGKPIGVALSSLLLDYLAKKGSVLVTPAILSSWGCPEPSKDCLKRTWLERVLAAPKKADPDNTLPTVAFAVRELGIAYREVSVVAEWTEVDRIVFRARATEEEDSACGAVRLVVPTVVFSGEIVSVQDGRLIARVHEERVPKVEVAKHASIDIIEYTAERRIAYLQELQGEPVLDTKYSYIKKWTKKTVYCNEALQAYKRVLVKVDKSMRRQLPKTVAAMLTQSLDELYRGPGMAPTPAAAAPPKK